MRIFGLSGSMHFCSLINIKTEKKFKPVLGSIVYIIQKIYLFFARKIMSSNQAQCIVSIFFGFFKVSNNI